jgi:GNAT superfamily N-acetyltransferase
MPPLLLSHLKDAAALFASNFRSLRASVPILPPAFEDPAIVLPKLEHLLEHSAGVAFMDGETLVGYLAWWEVDDFRGAGRRAAYAPVWAHSARREIFSTVYTALYSEASDAWFQQGCAVHALTTLADDAAMHQFWFWNAFGLAVVDAVRPAVPLDAPAPLGLQVRKASPMDAQAMADLEAEHARHYAAPPVLMVPGVPDGLDACAAFLSNPANAVWIALDGDRPVAYLRSEYASHGASEFVQGAGTAAVTGLYTQPGYRGRGAGAALLDAALHDYAAHGYERLSVDFESFNPTATRFWTRYFTPVCYSVIRVPERAVGEM